MKSNKSRRLSVLLISISLLYNSCTPVGPREGAIADFSQPDNRIVNREDYEDIKRSNWINVHLNDNSSKVGRFEEITEKYLILRTGGPGQWGKIEKISLDEILFVEIRPKNVFRRWLYVGLLIGLFFLPFILVDDEGQ